MAEKVPPGPDSASYTPGIRCEACGGTGTRLVWRGSKYLCEDATLCSKIWMYEDLLRGLDSA